jgi:hypothetical protein
LRLWGFAGLYGGDFLKTNAADIIATMPSDQPD